MGMCRDKSRDLRCDKNGQLTNENGAQIYDNEGIQREAYDYYTKLYTSKNHSLIDTNLKQVLSIYNIQKLSKIESDALGGPLNYIEVYNVLKNMKNNKSPGTDGFTVEFFKFFWKDIGHFLVRSLNYGYEHSMLSVTQKHGVITLIPKGDKPRQFLKKLEAYYPFKCFV